MSTQTNNIVVYNSGELQKIAAADRISIESISLTGNAADALAVTGGADINGALDVAGAAALGSTLAVTGAATLSSTLSAGASTLASLGVTGNADIDGTFNADGAATLGSTLAVTGVSTFSNDVTLSGAGSDLTVGGNASVSGTSTLTGAVAAGGNMTVGGTLGVTGTTTSGGALTVSSGGASITGNSSITGTLGVTGAADFDSTFNADGNATFGGTMTLSGNLDVGGGDFVVTAATGAVAMNGPGALTVTGLSNLDGGIAVDTTNFTVSGTTGATHVAGDFDVATNKFTVASASGNTIVAGTIGVTGAATFSSSLSANSLSSTTTLTAADADIGATLTVGTSDAFQVSAAGNISTTGTLGVTGATTLSSTLGVTGAATLSSTLNVASTLDVNSKFSVDGASGNVQTDGTLTVDGASTLTGNVSAGGSLSVAGTSTLTGNTSVGGTLSVTGASTLSSGSFSGDVSVGGDLTVAGDIVSRGTVNLTVQDAFIDLGLGNNSTTAEAGGFTVEMNRNAGFTNVWSNLTFTAGVSATSAPTISAGTAGSALAAGDIVVVSSAAPTSNDGYYVVNSVAGSVITLKGVGGVTPSASVPFAQTQVEAGVAASAVLFKADIAAVAVADGTSAFKNGAGASWSKGTFVTAYVPNAGEAGFNANNAWQSVGQVDLQEAYDTGNTINLADGRNLIVNAPASGAAAIALKANLASFLRVNNAAVDLSVYDAGGSTAQTQFVISASLVGGRYDAQIISEGQINLQSDHEVQIRAKAQPATMRVQNAGGTSLAFVQIGAAGNIVADTSGNGDITLDAGDSRLLLLRSDSIRKYDAVAATASSDGYSLPVANAVAAFKIVSATASGIDVASPTAPNIVGVSLSASAGSPASANIATAHGTICRIERSGAVSIGQVVYLTANGQVSATAPSVTGNTVMRVGYCVANNADVSPMFVFAPQFISKIL